VVVSPGTAVGEATAVGVDVGTVVGFVHPATIAAIATKEIVIAKMILFFKLSPYEYLGYVYLDIVITTVKLVVINR